MWQILKAEFGYTRDALVITYVIAALFLIPATTLAGWDIYDYMSNTTIVYFIFMGIAGASSINEKRYRYHSMLPVPPQHLAIGDALYVTAVQCGMVALWLACALLRPVPLSFGLLGDMITNSAVIVSIVTLFGIHYHLSFFATKRYAHFMVLSVLTLIAVGAGLAFLRKLPPVSKQFWQYYSSTEGMLASVFVCLGLTVASCAIFVRRRSFLA